MSTEAGRHTSVETAIAEVLGAERDALNRVEECKSTAEQIMRNARKAVRAMVRHTQKRISGLHSGSAAKTRELVAQLELEDAAVADRSLPNDEDEQRLLEAVSRVARELTERDTPGGG